MAMEALRMKNAVKAAVEAETKAGGEFHGFNVYDANNIPYRMFYPFAVIFAPINTQIGRYVGGHRAFQLSMRVDLYFNENQRMRVDGVVYNRDDVLRIYLERLENLLEALTFPTFSILGVPTVRSFTVIAEEDPGQVYIGQCAYLVAYNETD
jgi:hypothetical protein